MRGSTGKMVSLVDVFEVLQGFGLTELVILDLCSTRMLDRSHQRISVRLKCMLQNL